jgi:hypothetical protein
LLPGSLWHNRPDAAWIAGDIAILHDNTPYDRPCLFVAIDTDTWLQGSGNTGIYAGWKDTHTLLPEQASRYCGAIVQRKLAGLPPDFPQLVVVTVIRRFTYWPKKHGGDLTANWWPSQVPSAKPRPKRCWRRS